MSSDEAIMDEVVSNDNFMCGVIEGFYGKPWTAEQRKELFTRMKRFGMDTYMYAPKDDYKHRLYWRDLYRGPEADDLRQLIQMAREFDVDFVYAISPGLDMTLSSETEVNLLKAKLDQVAGFGCHSYALLFDDIEPELGAEDGHVFSSAGEAQAAITNQLYTHLGRPHTFLFCPTEYCTSRADPSLLKSEYLSTIGRELHPDIHVLWTGPKVVSRRITVESICEIKEILRRPPTIWDNLHANDYDQTRLFLGPYDGRPQELKAHLRGVLTNPNCEFEVNYVGMHSLAQWSKDVIQRFPTLDGDAMEVDPPKSGYQPKRALFCAIEDWIPEFYKPKGARPSKRTLSRITHLSVAPSDAPKPASREDSCRSDDDNSMDIVPTPCDMGTDSGSNFSSLSDLDTMSKVTKDSSNKGNRETNLPSGDRESEKTECSEQSVSSKSLSTDSANIGGNTASGGSPMDTTKEEVDGASSNVSDKRDCKPVSTDVGVSVSSSSKSQDTKVKCKIEEIDLLEMEDLLILCDLFYLPFEYGTRATHLLKKGHWLVTNVARLKHVDRRKSAERTPEVREWYENAIHFHDCFKEVVLMVDKLVNVPNRELLYELYNYVSDMRSALSLVNSFIKWNGLGRPDKEPFRGGEQEPWVHRSGIYAEFRRLLPIEGAADMFPPVEKNPPTQHVYTVRPYFPDDRDDVYSVCLRSCDDGQDGTDMFDKHTQLPADESVGPLLHLYPALCFVLEDETGICGYAACAPDTRKLQSRLEEEWLGKMRDKYPETGGAEEGDATATQELIRTFHAPPCRPSDDLLSHYPALLHLTLLPDRLSEGLTAARSLLTCALKCLRGGAGGGEAARGVHTLLHAGHRQTAGVWREMGFEEVKEGEYGKRDLMVMGRRL